MDYQALEPGAFRTEAPSPTSYQSHASRFSAVDQVRGLAIAAMILAHFGPGFYSRVEISGPVLDVLHLIGRFATPTFIAIFGFTIAFAYIPKALVNPEAVRNKLFGRAKVVLLAAIAVAVPSFLKTFLGGGEHWGGSMLMALLLDVQGVLFFYAAAIFTVAFFIGQISRAPFTFPLLLGSGLIFIGTWFGYDAWPHGEAGIIELLRLFLVSGKYAYLVNLGVALMLVSLGYLISNLLRSGVKVWPALLTIGVVMLLCGLSLGRVVGWRTLADLYTHYGAPPQLWYLCMVCGAMLVFLAMFSAVALPGVSFFLDHTGRNPLSLYVAHAFVLPSVSLMRAIAPSVPDILIIAVPLLMFLAYWTAVILRSSRSSKIASAPSR